MEYIPLIWCIGTLLSLLVTISVADDLPVPLPWAMAITILLWPLLMSLIVYHAVAAVIAATVGNEDDKQKPD